MAFVYFLSFKNMRYVPVAAIIINTCDVCTLLRVIAPHNVWQNLSQRFPAVDVEI